MNTIIPFKIAKLLKEKGFDENTKFGFNGAYEPHHLNIIEFGYLQRNSELLDTVYSAPTIADVIMWLYEKHGVWIEVIKNNYSRFEYKIINGTESLMYVKTPYKSLLSPTEAYEAAILYCLNNLI